MDSGEYYFQVNGLLNVGEITVRVSVSSKDVNIWLEPEVGVPRLFVSLKFVDAERLLEKLETAIRAEQQAAAKAAEDKRMEADAARAAKEEADAAAAGGEGTKANADRVQKEDAAFYASEGEAGKGGG